MPRLRLPHVAYVGPSICWCAPSVTPLSFMLGSPLRPWPLLGKQSTWGRCLDISTCLFVFVTRLTSLLCYMLAALVEFGSHAAMGFGWVLRAHGFFTGCWVTWADVLLIVMGRAVAPEVDIWIRNAVSAAGLGLAPSSIQLGMLNLVGVAAGAFGTAAAVQLPLSPCVGQPATTSCALLQAADYDRMLLLVAWALVAVVAPAHSCCTTRCTVLLRPVGISWVGCGPLSHGQHAEVCAVLCKSLFPVGAVAWVRVQGNSAQWCCTVTMQCLDRPSPVLCLSCCCLRVFGVVLCVLLYVWGISCCMGVAVLTLFVGVRLIRLLCPVT